MTRFRKSTSPGRMRIVLPERRRVRAPVSVLAQDPVVPVGTAVHIVQQYHLDAALQNPQGVNPIVGGQNFNAHEIYVCNHNINTANMAGAMNPQGVRVFQACPNLVYTFGDSDEVYGAVQAQVPESSYFHSALPGNINNRLFHNGNITAGSWFVRPSAEHGALIAAIVLANADPLFQGVLYDECHGKVPDHYWTAWKTAADGPTDPERPSYDILWAQCIRACFDGTKAGWGSSKAVYANTAKATYPGIDGIMIEGQNIVADPAGCNAAYIQQRAYWEGSPHKFGSHVGNMAYNNPLQIAGVVFPCYPLP